MIRLLRLLIVCSLSLSTVIYAADSGPVRLSPAIPGYGGAVHLPDAAVQLDPAREYKLVFNITEAGRDDGAPLPGLETAARFINLAALAGVPQDHVHIVMAIHGAGTPHALSNAVYRAKYGSDNPSLELINALADYGVDIYVCGQAMAGFGFQHSETSDSITVAVAALTVLVTYQLDGYALMSY